MKRMYKRFCMSALALFISSVGFVSAQINYSQNWDTGNLNTWTTSGGGTYSRSTTTPCAGDGSARANVYYDVPSYLISPALGGNNGGDLTVNFSYKWTTYDDNSVGAAGTQIDYLKVQWATAAAGPYVDALVLPGSTHVASTSCVDATTTISGLPEGNIFIRFATNALEDDDLYCYIDNVAITQGPGPYCPVPSALTYNSLTTNSVNLAWTTSTVESAWNVQWGTPGFTPGTGAEIGSYAATGTPTASIGSLSASTSYHFYVQADCGAGSLSSWVGPLAVYTGHCLPSTTNTNSSITNFTTTGAQLNISNATTGATGGYGNYYGTHQLVAAPGTVVNFNTAIAGGSVGYAVWIDWNNNLTFEAGEKVFGTTSYGNGPFTGNFTIPAGQAQGEYRMRMVVNYNSSTITDACLNISRGEYEDYKVVVYSLPAPSAPVQAAGVPTCADGSELTFSGTALPNVEYYWQTSATGTSTANNASNPLVVFENGTYYVRAFNAAYNYWSASSSVAVTNIPLIAAPPAPLAAANPACVPGTEIVMASNPPAGVTYYWQGTSSTSSSQSENASSPYNVTATGTYYVKAFDSATSCWSLPSSTLVTVNTVIPANPTTSVPFVNACSGEASILVAGQPSGLPLTYTLRKLDSANDGWSGNSINVLVNGVVVLSNVTLSSGGQEDQTFIVTEGSVITTAWNTTGSWASEVSYRILNENGVIVGGVGNSTTQINYTVPMGAYPLAWYDAAVGGNLVGTGSPFEAVGSSLISSPATVGTYEFYLAATLGACESVERALVTVNVTSVHVVFSTQDVSCNNGNDGTFDVASTVCGTPPFTFSVDGGAFGAIPTDLTIGEHTVVVKDANDDESAEYIITIGNALAPFNVTEINTTSNESTISWTAPGNEIQWNVVWGPIGFTPGDADQIGSATANDTVFTVTGLVGNTEYDIYVSADCGNGTVPGDWSSVEIWTECDGYSLPFHETFELETSPTISCWISDNQGAGSWYIGVGSEDSGPVTTAYEGTQNAYYNGGSSGRLVSPVMIVSNLDSVAVRFAISQVDWLGDQNTTTLAVRNGTSAAWTVAKTYVNEIPSWMVDTVVINTTGMDSLQISFLAVDEIGYNNTIDDVRVEACYIEPTADGAITVCRTEGSIDLATVTTPMASGIWNGGDFNSFVNGSNFNISNLVEGTYVIKHIAKTACASDTAEVTVTVTAPLSAGVDGTLNVCKNQPIGLFTGLSGNVDYGGTWYTAAGVALTGSTLTTGTLQGQQVYTYVVSNGICDADTSTVIVNIGACNFIGVDDVELFDNVTISPNPSTGVFNIEGVKSPDFTYEVVDMNGRIIKGETKITSSVTSVNLTTVETGVYMIRLKGEGSEKMIRLIKQ